MNRREYMRNYMRKYWLNHKKEKKIYNHNRYIIDREKRKKYNIIHYTDKLKILAQNRTNRLFKNSNIKRNDFICAICGKQPVQFHHENYELWYVIIPLCCRHHARMHEQIVMITNKTGSNISVNKQIDR